MPTQDDLYKDTVRSYGPALNRLARAYEADPENCRDLLQEIHLALWRSFESYDARCSLRTWVYRVAHNAATSHVVRSLRKRPKTMIGLEDLDRAGGIASGNHFGAVVERAQLVERLYELIQLLNPLDRQIIVLYLEDMDAATIGEVTGISPGYVATKIHRIKTVLAIRFKNGGGHGE